jgi:hypothetical protein
MTGLPTSLSIGLWFVGAIWLVGILAFVNDAPGELVWASFLVGLFAGLAEWLAHSRLACAAPHGPFPKGRRPVPAAPHGRPPRPSSAATPPASRAATAPSRPAGAAADGREAPPPSPQRRPPRRHIRPAARRQPDPRARPPRPAPLPARPPPALARDDEHNRSKSGCEQRIRRLEPEDGSHAVPKEGKGAVDGRSKRSRKRRHERFDPALRYLLVSASPTREFDAPQLEHPRKLLGPRPEARGAAAGIGKTKQLNRSLVIPPIIEHPLPAASLLHFPSHISA